MKQSQCPKCGHVNPQDARFCQSCGGGLRRSTDPLIDRQIGNHRVVERIGAGGMGVVYLAEHINLGKRHAVKFLHPQFAADSEVVERFRREARVLASLEHENIIREVDFGWLEGVGFYLIMEYLEGETLKDLIRDEGALTWRRVQPIFEQLLDALSVAHSQGIVHRDLKPENLFLIKRRGREQLKILDFGIARIAYNEGQNEVTSDGEVYGSPSYMSPEQARGEINRVDHRADIYAAGVILIEALTGKLPFQAQTAAEMMLSHISAAVPPLGQLCPQRDFPASLDGIAQRALAKEPELRFASAREMMRSLQRSWPECAQMPRSEAPVPKPAPARKPADALRDAATPRRASQANASPRTTQGPRFAAPPSMTPAAPSSTMHPGAARAVMTDNQDAGQRIDSDGPWQQRSGRFTPAPMSDLPQVEATAMLDLDGLLHGSTPAKGQSWSETSPHQSQAGRPSIANVIPDLSQAQEETKCLDISQITGQQPGLPNSTLGQNPTPMDPMPAVEAGIGNFAQTAHLELDPQTQDQLNAVLQAPTKAFDVPDFSQNPQGAEDAVRAAVARANEKHKPQRTKKSGQGSKKGLKIAIFAVLPLSLIAMALGGWWLWSQQEAPELNPPRLPPKFSRRGLPPLPAKRRTTRVAKRLPALRTTPADVARKAMQQARQGQAHRPSIPEVRRQAPGATRQILAVRRQPPPPRRNIIPQVRAVARATPPVVRRKRPVVRRTVRRRYVKRRYVRRKRRYVRRSNRIKLTLKTMPAGARVSVSPGGYSCRTPCTLRIRKRRQVVVKLSKSGYITRKLTLNPTQPLRFSLRLVKDIF